MRYGEEEVPMWRSWPWILSANQIPHCPSIDGGWPLLQGKEASEGDRLQTASFITR